MQPFEAREDAAPTDRTTINRERAERRRAVARTVRDLRERLTSASGTRPAFDRELALTFARTRLATAYTLPFLILLISIAATAFLPVVVVLAWAAVMLSCHAVTVLLSRAFARDPTSGASLRAWNRRFALAELGCGVVWALLMVIAAREHTPGLETFIFATMLTVLAVGTLLASSAPHVAVAGTLPVTMTVAALLVARGDLVYMVLAGTTLGAQAFFLLLAQRLYASTLDTLEARAEKDHLIAELGTAKAISDESRRRAEEANLAKSRFLATMSHELRTPLNAILGFSEVMKNEVLGPMPNANYREYAGDIHASGQHLLHLINEILDLSRVEAGRYELHEEPVTLTGVIEECENLLRLKARNKNLTVAKQFEQGLPRLWADERAVRQVVLNLLSNAVKFTPQGGEITIKAGWTAGGGQYVSIRDNGPGIPEEEIPIVLAAFGQGSIAIKSAEPGTGLGLSIVDALMRTHDGTFELKSKLREGTEAIVTFPRSRVMEPLPPVLETPDRPQGRGRRAG